MKNKVEYIWLDAKGNLRSKTKILNNFTTNEFPLWYFDGSSTGQAEGSYSDCALKPIRKIHDPHRKDSFLLLCEVLNADLSPHESNHRKTVSEDIWFGFEQEYVLMKDGQPLGFTGEPQGEFYCGVGGGKVTGRDFVEIHLDSCLNAGLNITGINAEVLIGQWEFQLFGGGTKAADDLLLARYLLLRTSEEYGVQISFHPKPLEGDWNGSGMHTNFSTELMRTSGNKKDFDNILFSLGASTEEAIAAYGEDNHLRLTGKHETQSIDKFSYGVSDRGASIRIPQDTAKDWRGYLEDRRPAANANPYKVINYLSSVL